MAGRCVRFPALLVALWASAQASVLSLDDSSELLQSSTHVKEPEKQNPVNKMKAAIEKMQTSFTDRVAEQVRQLTRDAVREELARRHEETAVAKAKPTPAVAPVNLNALSSHGAVVAMAERSQERNSVELKKRSSSKYGDDMRLIVRLPTGRELPIGFHTGVRLQAVMHSICNKLQVPFNGTKFVTNGRELNPMLTPEEFGLEEGAIVEAHGNQLMETLQAQLESEKKAREEAKAALHRQEAKAKARVAAQEARHRSQKKEDLAEAEAQRVHELKLDGRVTLQFQREVAGVAVGAPVAIAARQDNWLQGTLQLAAKRLGVDMDEARFILFGALKTEIKPHDTAKALGLKGKAMVWVKTPFKPKKE